MSKILCPFCFEEFKSSQTLFRCINSRCSGQAPDKTYAKYQGLLSAPKLGLSFAPREGGIKKIAGLFQGPREVSCPTCQRPTPKRICPTCHYELMYDAGRTKERTIAVIGGRSAGKSIYITTLIHCLFNQVGTNFNAGVMARGDLTRNRYQNDFYKPLYSEGRLLPPTQTAEVNARTKTPMVFRVTIDDGGKRQAVNLVLFDTAGEDMQNLDIMSTEARYICYSDGIIFLLDSLQIEAVRQQLSDDTQLPPLDPGNEKLPTLDILGRSKLKQKCPNPDCSSPIEGLGGTNLHLPIVGGPAAGKSHYIAMAVIQLIRDFAPTHSLQITLPNQEHQTNYDTNVKRLESGQRLLKTADLGDSAKAFNLQIKKSNRAVPKLLYLYDAAGESWTLEDRALLQKYFEYLHGIVLIIDPFSLEQVRTAYSSELSSNPGIISPSSENPEAVYERMVELLEIKFRGKTSLRFKQPVAVILTKSDAFDLEQKIGKDAALEYRQSHPELQWDADAINALVEQFLQDYGAGNFLRNLRGKFDNIKFFSCSTIGVGNNSETASAFEGERVLEPLLWLLKETKTLPRKVSKGIPV